MTKLPTIEAELTSTLRRAYEAEGVDVSKPAFWRSVATMLPPHSKQDHVPPRFSGRPQLADPELSKSDAQKVKNEFLTWLRKPIQLCKVHHSVTQKILPTDLPVHAHVLLVNHNWYALLKNSATSGPAGIVGIRLPYPITVFEFNFTGGVHAVCVAVQLVTNAVTSSITHFKTKTGWLKVDLDLTYDPHGNLVKPISVDPTHPFVTVYNLITNNIYAISVMLEARVATTTPVREAYKRNRERPIRKELPHLSHHVVSLVPRPRTTPAEGGGEERQSPRLHFRRGHFRHYANHRTWISWQLVGDPDLGFVDKEYSL